MVVTFLGSTAAVGPVAGVFAVRTALLSVGPGPFTVGHALFPVLAGVGAVDLDPASGPGPPTRGHPRRRPVWLPLAPATRSGRRGPRPTRHDPGRCGTCRCRSSMRGPCPLRCEYPCLPRVLRQARSRASAARSRVSAATSAASARASRSPTSMSRRTDLSSRSSLRRSRRSAARSRASAAPVTLVGGAIPLVGDPVALVGRPDRARSPCAPALPLSYLPGTCRPARPFPRFRSLPPARGLRIPRLSLVATGAGRLRQGVQGRTVRWNTSTCRRLPRRPGQGERSSRPSALDTACPATRPQPRRSHHRTRGPGLARRGSRPERHTADQPSAGPRHHGRSRDAPHRLDRAEVGSAARPGGEGNLVRAVCCWLMRQAAGHRPGGCSSGQPTVSSSGDEVAASAAVGPRR